MSIQLVKVALAQLPTRIVPDCSPTSTDPEVACNTCHIAETAQNVLTTFIYVAIFALIIMVVAGGARFFFSGGNPESIRAARKHITAAIVGLVITLVAWVGINILIDFFVDEEKLGVDWKWYQLEGLTCTIQTISTEAECVDFHCSNLNDAEALDYCTKWCRAEYGEASGD